MGLKSGKIMLLESVGRRENFDEVSLIIGIHAKAINGHKRRNRKYKG